MYLALPRWVLGVNVHPSERPPEPNGTLRNGKLVELRPESGILGILGAAFCFLSTSPRLRRFRVFIVSALGIKKPKFNPERKLGAESTQFLRKPITGEYVFVSFADHSGEHSTSTERHRVSKYWKETRRRGRTPH